MVDFLKNETAVISMIVTAVTGLLTGPVFRMDPAAVGSITAAVVAVFNLWVRFSVYSKQGALNVATEAAVKTAEKLTTDTVGATGHITETGTQVAVDTAKEVVNGVGDLVGGLLPGK